MTIDSIMRRLRLLFGKVMVHSISQLKRKAGYEKLDLAKSIPGEEAIASLYQHYVTQYSRADMAISFELAKSILNLCHTQLPRKTLDLGSGFSSWVFRKYAKENNATGWSVDDDPAWLEKTKKFLSENNLETDHCIVLQDFIQSDETGFDMVLLDLNFVEVRKNYIQLAVERCRKGGLVLFDDVHKADYRDDVLKLCWSLPIRLYDIRDYTLDKFARYTWLGIKY